MHAIIFTCLKSSLNFFFFIHLIFNPQNMSSPNTSLHIRCYCPSSVRCQFSWLLSLLPPLPHTVHCLHSRQDQPFKCRPVYAASLLRTFCWFAILVSPNSQNPCILSQKSLRCISLLAFSMSFPTPCPLAYSLVRWPPCHSWTQQHILFCRPLCLLFYLLNYNILSPNIPMSGFSFF